MAFARRDCEPPALHLPTDRIENDKPLIAAGGGELRLVRSIVPDALALNSSGDCAISLPMSSLPHIPALLDALDAQGQELGLESYGLNTTTLEQVFLWQSASVR